MIITNIYTHSESRSDKTQTVQSHISATRLNSYTIHRLHSDIVRRSLPGDPPKYDTLEQTVSAEPIVAVDATGHLPGRVQPRHRPLHGSCVRLLHLSVDVHLQPSHAVVQRGRDVRDEEVVVVSERDREDGLPEHVAATFRRGPVHDERLSENVDADGEFLGDLLEGSHVFDEPLEAIESDGGSAEAIDDGLSEEHRGDNRVPFNALEHGETETPKMHRQWYVILNVTIYIYIYT